MLSACEWLHEQLSTLPLITYPFTSSELPLSGIYAFYERGEHQSHDAATPRIVRVGTHRGGSFPARIADHYLLDEEKKMDFDATKPAPKDRSIFRKNIGRALLNRAQDPYLAVWQRDFTARAAKVKFGHLRDIAKEQALEREITSILRANFSFRYIIFDALEQRVGAAGFERSLIGTLARCADCRPSDMWLGQHSPDARIRASGLWQVQHLKNRELRDEERGAITEAIAQTKAWTDDVAK